MSLCHFGPLNTLLSSYSQSEFSWEPSKIFILGIQRPANASLHELSESGLRSDLSWKLSSKKIFTKRTQFQPKTSVFWAILTENRPKYRGPNYLCTSMFYLVVYVDAPKIHWKGLIWCLPCSTNQEQAVAGLKSKIGWKFVGYGPIYWLKIHQVFISKSQNQAWNLPFSGVKKSFLKTGFWP